MFELPFGVYLAIVGLLFLKLPQCDRQTDRQADRQDHTSLSRLTRGEMQRTQNTAEQTIPWISRLLRHSTLRKRDALILQRIGVGARGYGDVRQTAQQ